MSTRFMAVNTRLRFLVSCLRWSKSYWTSRCRKESALIEMMMEMTVGLEWQILFSNGSNREKYCSLTRLLSVETLIEWS